MKKKGLIISITAITTSIGLLLLPPVRLFLELFLAVFIYYGSAIYDASFEKKVMTYDLGTDKHITLLKDDDFIYVMPYVYDKRTPPKDDFIKLKRRNYYYAYLLFKNDSTLMFYENDKESVVNFKKFKCEYFYGYPDNENIPYPDNLDRLYYSRQAYVEYDSLNVDTKVIRDSLLLMPRLELSIFDFPLELNIRRVDNGRITSHSYKGYKELEDKMYLIKD